MIENQIVEPTRDIARAESTYCSYYQGRVVRNESHFLVAILKSFEHVAFDRTINIEENIFEFFVPPAMEDYFLYVAKRLQDEHVLCDLQKMPNRLLDPAEQV